MITDTMVKSEGKEVDLLRPRGNAALALLSVRGILTSLSQNYKGKERTHCMGARALATGSDHIWADRFSLKLSFEN